MVKFVFKNNESSNVEKTYTQAALDEAIRNALEKQKNTLLKDLSEKCQESYERGYKEGKTASENENQYTFTQDLSGKMISFSNGKFIIDGVEVSYDSNGKPITKKLASVVINGDAGSVTGTSGTIIVKGNVKGSVTCTSGMIKCGNVSGDVKATSGMINYRK